MINLAAGLILLGGSVAALWYFRPRNGMPAKIVTLPLMETLVPLGVTSGLALGMAMVVAGVLG